MNTAAAISGQPPAEPVVLHAWPSYKSRSYSDNSDFGHNSQGYWYRMREQRTHGWTLEPLCYFLKLSMLDAQGRLWQCAMPAVVDDFGSLVEVAR